MRSYQRDSFLDLRRVFWLRGLRVLTEWRSTVNLTFLGNGHGYDKNPSFERHVVWLVCRTEPPPKLFYIWLQQQDTALLS